MLPISSQLTAADVLGRALAHALGFGFAPATSPPSRQPAGASRQRSCSRLADRCAGVSAAQIRIRRAADSVHAFDTAAAAQIKHFETYNRTAAGQRVADIVVRLSRASRRGAGRLGRRGAGRAACRRGDTCQHGGARCRRLRYLERRRLSEPPVCARPPPGRRTPDRRHARRHVGADSQCGRTLYARRREVRHERLTPTKSSPPFVPADNRYRVSTCVYTSTLIDHP